MKINDVIKILDAEVVCGKIDDTCEVDTAFGADLMSDVLAFVKADTLVLTGMVNPHVIRTAEMVDVRYIVFVRGKRPTQDIIDLANELGMVLMATQKTLFTACGLLYCEGLVGCARSESNE